MAKKIRFPLEMEQGIEVRSLEELKENFSLARVLVYLENGKLITWLRDRYVDDVADAIEEVKKDDKDLAKRICDIFDVPYNEQKEADLEEAAEHNRKLNLLKEYTDEQKYIDVVDQVAFSKDDLYNLLDEGKDTIYLCGEKFSIPLAKKGISYIGVNNPTAIINSKTVVDWKEKNIIVQGIQFDKNYQKVLLERDNIEQEDQQAKQVRLLKYVIESDEKCLVELDMEQQREKIIEKNVSDFFEYEKEIYFICKKKAGEYIVKQYDKKTQTINDLILLNGLDTYLEYRLYRRLFWSGNNVKYRYICVTPQKIVYVKEDGYAYSINHDGSNCLKLTVCGNNVEPITISGNSYYYLNNQQYRTGLYKYNLFTRENVKLAENAESILYTENYLYYESLRGSDVFGWKFMEVNLDYSQ